MSNELNTLEGWKAGLWRYGFNGQDFGLSPTGPYVLLEQVEKELASQAGKPAAPLEELRAWDGGVSICLLADAQRLLAERDAKIEALTEYAAAVEKSADAAEKERDALRKDAERYRWLRNPDRVPNDSPCGHLIVGEAEGEDIHWRDHLDRSIDNAMALETEA